MLMGKSNLEQIEVEEEEEMAWVKGKKENQKPLIYASRKGF